MGSGLGQGRLKVPKRVGRRLELKAAKQNKADLP